MTTPTARAALLRIWNRLLFLKKKQQKDFFNLGHGGFKSPAHQTRHCKRSEAIHLSFGCTKTMDCFAALAMAAWLFSK
jgi:hypothetical protein